MKPPAAVSHIILGWSSMDPFFELAGRSITRQRHFRQLVTLHVATVAITCLIASWRQDRQIAGTIGVTLMLLGIVEGAIVIGWRLSQWPKSKAMELLLVTALSPRRAMLGEQLVGITILSLVALTAAPLLVWLVAWGWLAPLEAIALPVNGLLWGMACGLGLSWWAYEPLAIRRWGERLSIVGLLIYLVVGGLAGEHTFRMLGAVPFGLGHLILDSFLLFHRNNPLALAHAVGVGIDDDLMRRLIVVDFLAVAMIVAFVIRSAFRLKPHYVERHYQPTKAVAKQKRPAVGERPLTWWAVRRVHEYSGRINLYLAAGATVLYSAFLILGRHWPSWLGSGIFDVFESMGGVGGIATGLVVLAAVPAAYQFGLWESNAPERQKRLELFLLTDLSGQDYARASWAAAWSRGRGYFFSAILLLTAGYLAGRYSFPQLLLATTAGVGLIFFYFAAGFRLLAKSQGGTSTGIILTLVLPLFVWGLGKSDWPVLATFLPPGQIFFATVPGGAVVPAFSIALLCLAIFGFSALLLWRACRDFDREVRDWFSSSIGSR